MPALLTNSVQTVNFFTLFKLSLRSLYSTFLLPFYIGEHGELS